MLFGGFKCGPLLPLTYPLSHSDISRPDFQHFLHVTDKSCEYELYCGFWRQYC